MITRRTFLAVAGVASLVACAPGTGSTLDRARSNGALRVGLSGEEPFGYTDTGGRITGSQPEVARAVLAGMGIGSLDAVQVGFDQLIPGLLAGQFDMIAAGMSVTPARCARVAFSRPDFLAPPAFLVRTGNPRGIRTFRDVARSGVRLAVLPDSSERDYARAAGVSDDQLVDYGSQGALFRAVAAQDVPVGALTAISLADVLRRNPGSGVEVTAPVDPTIAGRAVVPAGAFAVRPADTDLLAPFDAGLAALQSSGEWLRITAPFGFGPANLPPTNLTVDALCGPEPKLPGSN